MRALIAEHEGIIQYCRHENVFKLKKKYRANTKVTLAVHHHVLSQELPSEMVEKIRKLNSYNEMKGVLEITSDETPKQQRNVDIAYRKLDSSLKKVANEIIAKEDAESARTAKKGSTFNHGDP